MKFSEMPYRRPDTGAVKAAFAALAKRAAAVSSDGEATALYRELDRTESDYATMAQLASIRYTLDTRDAYWAAEREFYDAATPEVSNAELGVYRALLANPHAAALDRTFGPVVTPGMKNAVLAMDERTLPLQQEDNALVSAYQKLYGAAMVTFDGRSLTLPQLGKYKESPDRAVRRAAYEAEAGYFDAHRADFDELYGKMIVCRNKQAQLLGFADYSELSYVRMNRLGYGPAEVENYRAQVVRDVVPLCAELMQLRWKRAGLTDVKFWDSPIAFADGNPAPNRAPAEMMENCRRMYHELSPETGEFIDFMLASDLFDVESRPGKAPGGYCELIRNYSAPFIFANWNGTSADVDVLTHEAGHAFEWYLASRDPSLPSGLTAPGMESCEIHSMSMEFFTAPWRELFFAPADAKKYELAHAEDAFFFLPYGCMVDEFQHIMYRRPQLTPDERCEVWLSLEKKYRPWNDFGDLPFFSRGAGWQRQLHIYECPFYYIDYCLAQTVALQFFAARLRDPADAWQRYMRLVRRAGRDTYAGLVAAAGLRVPFETGSLAGVAAEVAGWVRGHQL